jgi:hypothetical protein
MKKTSAVLIFLALGVLLIGAPYSSAYLQYADTGIGGCDNCHGAYDDNQSYISLVDNADWGTDLMGTHETMLNNDCNVCHVPDVVFYPVFLNSAPGGSGLDPISCMGCHGRAEDRGTELDCVDPNNPATPCGDGVGMRQHHYNASPNFAGQICLSCHADTHPANYTPVDEDVKPPYYTPNPDPNYPNKPTDPCNPNGEENYAGTGIGLDNDGDLLYDGNDCNLNPGIPGDCNSDQLVDAGDLTALVLEIFDDDGNLPVNTPGSTFPGDPVGCNANEDGIIDAGDLTCTVLLIFNGPGACGGGASASAAGEPLSGAAQTDFEDVPVDLDIVKVELSGNGTTGKTIRKLRLTVKNANGSGEDMKPATLIGVQNGKEVYNETRTVFDLSGNGRSRFAFPPFTPTEAGAIDWTVSIADDDPDYDTVTATTIVR